MKKRLRSADGNADCNVDNQQEEDNAAYPKWKVCIIYVLAVSVLMHRTNLVFLIPIVSKYLPTSEEAVYFFHTSPTYAKNTIGFRSKLWIDRNFKHICLPVAVIFCIVCILVLFYKLAVKKICKESEEKLDTFFDELHRKELDLLSNWTTGEINEITDRISDNISNIVFGSFEDDDIFRLERTAIHEHVRLVGSMSEGTKIRNPDEFDFVFIWPHFTESNTIVEDIMKSPFDIKIWYSGNSVSQLIERKLISKKDERSVTRLISPSKLFSFFCMKILEYVSHLPDCYIRVYSSAVTLFFENMVLESGKRICVAVDLVPVISLPKSKAHHLLSKRLPKKVLNKMKDIYLSHIPTGRTVKSKSNGKKVSSTCFTVKDTFSICLPHVENILMKYFAKKQPNLIRSYQILKDMQPLLDSFVYAKERPSPYKFDLNSYQLKCLILEMALKNKQPYTEMSLSTMIIVLWEKILLSYFHAAGKGNVAIPTLLTKIKNRHSLRCSVRDAFLLRTILKRKRDMLVSFFEKIVNDRTYNFEECLEQYNDFLELSDESFVTVTESRTFRSNFAL